MKNDNNELLTSLITSHFDLSEIKSVFFSLGLNINSVPQNANIDGFAIHLATHFARLNQKDVLLTTLRQKRPNVNWPDSYDVLNFIPNLPRAIPFQTLPRATNFTGRRLELDWLSKKIFPGNAVSIIAPGGVGKSALVAETIYRVNKDGELFTRFPDGVIVHSFYGQVNMELVYKNIIQSYDKYSNDFSVESVRRILSHKTALIIFDGVEEARDFSHLLNVLGHKGIIITSRKKSDTYGELLSLSTLKETDSIELLYAFAKDQIENEKDAKAICKIVDNLTLALQLVGRYLFETGETSSIYLNWLVDNPVEALQLDEVNSRKDSFKRLMRRSIEQIGKDAESILAIVGLLAMAPFSRKAISAALPNASINKTLNRMVNFGLLSRSKEKYIVSHALIHEYSKAVLTPNSGSFANLANFYANSIKKEYDPE